MLRIAILEQEDFTKDIIFELRNYIHIDWTFSYFSKISQFANQDQNTPFDIIIFHSIFHTEKILNYLTGKKNALLLCTSILPEQQQNIQILYFDRNNLKSELERISPIFEQRLKNFDTYIFTYNYVDVILRIHDIYYLEKINKDIHFYTTKGIFHQRITMSEIEKRFKPYGFLRPHASYLVNQEKIVQFNHDNLVLSNQSIVPISRSRLKEITAFMNTFKTSLPKRTNMQQI